MYLAVTYTCNYSVFVFNFCTDFLTLVSRFEAHKPTENMRKCQVLHVLFIVTTLRLFHKKLETPFPVTFCTSLAHLVIAWLAYFSLMIDILARMIVITIDICLVCCRCHTTPIGD